MTAPEGFWSGNCDATDQDHNAIYDQYGQTGLPAYRFQVSDDYRAVQVVTAAQDPWASNGIWTLAEIRARHELPELVDHVARLMIDAIALLKPWSRGHSGEVLTTDEI